MKKSDAEKVMELMQTGEWTLTRNQPCGYLTYAANLKVAWTVGRQVAPYCDLGGTRLWSASTALRAFERAIIAINKPYQRIL